MVKKFLGTERYNKLTLFLTLDKIFVLFIVGMFSGSLLFAEATFGNVKSATSPKPENILNNILINLNDRGGKTVNNHAILPSDSPLPSNRQLKPIGQDYGIKIPILMYHYVGNYYNPDSDDPNNLLMGGLAVTTTNFEQQMHYLVKSGYKTLDLDEVLQIHGGKRPLNQNSIVLTFDDGYKDFYTNAYPVLKKYNLKAVVFLVTNFMDKDNYLNYPMVEEMYKSGLISFGSHTVSHSSLTQISEKQVISEIVTSKKILESTLGYKIRFFCYPYGHFNNLAVNKVKEAGYSMAFTTSNGKWTEETDLLRTPRIRISGYYSIQSFISLL